MNRRAPNRHPRIPAHARNEWRPAQIAGNSRKWQGNKKFAVDHPSSLRRKPGPQPRTSEARAVPKSRRAPNRHSPTEPALDLIGGGNPMPRSPDLSPNTYGDARIYSSTASLAPFGRRLEAIKRKYARVFVVAHFGRSPTRSPNFGTSPSPKNSPSPAHFCAPTRSSSPDSA